MKELIIGVVIGVVGSKMLGKVQKEREGARIKGNKFRPGATLQEISKPRSLAECGSVCDCLPLKREIRSTPVEEQNIAFYRNLIEPDYDYPGYCTN